MRIIISPAKKMRIDPDSFPVWAMPQFLAQAEQLQARLQQMPYPQLRALWCCSDRIAAPCYEQLFLPLREASTPAIMAYEGIQYQYMAPGVFSDRELHYIQEHLRILSGFYGLLRPFDAVMPYRLEMQARLSVDGSRDLYAFWGARLAQLLAEETTLLVNLASREYSKSVLPHLPPSVRTIPCVFGQLQQGRIVEKGTLCKMARGEMVRYLAETDAADAEVLREFDRLHYRFSPAHSDPTRFVFLQTQDRTEKQASDQVE